MLLIMINNGVLGAMLTFETTFFSYMTDNPVFLFIVTQITNGNTNYHSEPIKLSTKVTLMFAIMIKWCFTCYGYIAKNVLNVCGLDKKR